MTTTINVFPPADAPPPAEPITGPQDLNRQRLQALMRRDRQPIRADYPAVSDGGGTATTVTIRLYDPIDSWGEWFGISAKEMASVLDDLPDSVTEIRLLINSPGGEVTEGIAILNLLRNHPARIVGVVEGMAASSASFIAAGCDELQMNPNAEIMVHDAWGLVVGPAADMREMADTLDHLSDNIASVYVAKAGGTIAAWREVMSKDTWYSAEQAVAAGLADSVTKPATDAKPSARVDHSIFNSVGHTPGPKSPVGQPAAGSSATTEGGPAVALSDEHDTNLREKLGVDADADGDSILAAVDVLLEQATAPTPEPEPATLPDGVVAISEAPLAPLKADAQQGRDAREAQLRNERESLVNTAITDGRIAPAERDGWLAKLETGTGAEHVLAALKPGLIPVEQLGSGGAADLDAELADYVAIYGKES